MSKILEIVCRGRVNGLGKFDDSGSYLLFAIWNKHGEGSRSDFMISEGAAHCLISEMSDVLDSFAHDSL